MPLNTLDFNTIVQNEVAAAQASSSSLLDFSAGSVLLALIQANASAVALWLQGLDVYILSLARAATSNGADLDSWMADFGLTRNPATFAIGLVTFARFTTTAQALVPIGAQVQTANASQTYTVTVDTTNPNYNAGLNGYIITIGTSSIDVPVIANTAGTQGNAIANAINVITTPMAFVDTVTNSSAFTNALNAETDAAFRLRFVAYLGSLSKATYAAISYAISQVQGVVDFTITENQAYGGATQLGYFYVVVDDGTGTPPGNLLSNVNNAVDAVRGLTIQFGVFAPVIETANVVMTVNAAPGYVHSDVATIVSAALQSYIDSLVLGETLYYTRLSQVAYDSTPGVLNVTAVTLNSGTSDLTATAKQIIKAGTITIN